MSDEQDDIEEMIQAALRQAKVRTEAVRTLRDWINDPNKLLCAESVDPDGELNFMWRFRFEGYRGGGFGGFEYRRGTWHPKGKTGYKFLGCDPQQALQKLEQLEISPDTLVKESLI